MTDEQETIGREQAALFAIVMGAMLDDLEGTVPHATLERVARKASRALLGHFVRGSVAAGTIEAKPVPCTRHKWCGFEDGHDGDCAMPF